MPLATKTFPAAVPESGSVRAKTKFFGELNYHTGDVFYFPSGLPGFEDRQDYLLLNIPHCQPLIFMQSLGCASLCFVLLPILAADPDYRLELTLEELVELNLSLDRQPRIGEDILCAAIISVSEDDHLPTANLMAPLVINLRTKEGLQVIHAESGYSFRHPIRSQDHSPSC